MKAESDGADGRIIREADVATVNQIVVFMDEFGQFVIGFSHCAAHMEVKVLENHYLCGKSQVHYLIAARLSREHARHHRGVNGIQIRTAALEKLVLYGNDRAALDRNHADRESGVDAYASASRNGEIGFPVKAKEVRR